jgi:phage terminase large subunit
MAVKELMKPMKDGRPGLLVFESCRGLIDDLMAIQHDEKNPSDCAKTPHELTHRPDALRYFCQLRTMPPEQTEEEEEYFEPRPAQSYDDYMTGGDLDESYLCYSR